MCLWWYWHACLHWSVFIHVYMCVCLYIHVCGCGYAYVSDTVLTTCCTPGILAMPLAIPFTKDSIIVNRWVTYPEVPLAGRHTHAWTHTHTRTHTLNLLVGSRSECLMITVCM